MSSGNPQRNSVYGGQLPNAGGKRSSPSMSGAGAILEGLERRMAQKKDGAAAVHVLLPEEDEDDDDEESGDEHRGTNGASGAVNGGAETCSTNEQPPRRTIETSGGDDGSPCRRRRADNELTFLQGHLYPSEWPKTLLAMALLLAAALCNGLVIAYIHQIVGAKPALEDVVFRLVPYQRWAWTVADVMVTVCASTCLLVVLFHKQNSIVLRRTALLTAVLYLLRGAFLLCTYLPPPFPDSSERCLPRWNISSDPLQFFARAFGLVFTVGFTGNSDRILCGDTIFSGHTMIYCLAGLVVWNYCPRPWRPVVPLLMVFAVVFGVVAVLISRQHYTIDVVVALFVTLSIFYGYHVWCRQRRDRVACAIGVYDRNCCGASVTAAKCRFRPIYAMFLFFERRVPHGSLPKELAWPFPFPAVMVDLFERWNGCDGSQPIDRDQKRRRLHRPRKSSSCGSGLGGSRNALTNSNSGLLSHSSSGQQQQHNQQAQLQQQQQQQVLAV